MGGSHEYILKPVWGEQICTRQSSSSSFGMVKNKAHLKLIGVRLETKLCTARVSVTNCAQSDLLYYQSIGVSSAQLNIRLQKQKI